MNYKIILGIILTTILSSCCWLAHDDCAEIGSPPFPIEVEMNPIDTIHDIDSLLQVTIKSTDFLSIYQEEEYNQFNFNIQVEWFNGNFSSDAGHQVNILNSSVGNLNTQEYTSYYGPLPTDDISFDLEFTVPGYYLIYFNGSANKTVESSRRRPRNGCSNCNDNAYTSFSFENAMNNQQYFDLYNNSKPYDEDLNSLLYQGAYFVKVE